MRRSICALALALAAPAAAPRLQAAEPRAAMERVPDRRPDEGEGPYRRLVIRGATLIDGSGAPPLGPVDIVIEGNRITDIQGVGYPKVPIDTARRPRRG